MGLSNQGYKEGNYAHNTILTITLRPMIPQVRREAQAVGLAQIFQSYEEGLGLSEGGFLLWGLRFGIFTARGRYSGNTGFGS